MVSYSCVQDMSSTSILKTNPCIIQKQASACDQVRACSLSLSPSTHTHTHTIMQLGNGQTTLLSMPTSKTTRQTVYKIYLFKHVIILINIYQNCIKINQFLILPHSKLPKLNMDVSLHIKKPKLSTVFSVSESLL